MTLLPASGAQQEAIIDNTDLSGTAWSQACHLSCPSLLMELAALINCSAPL